jgi:pilus assembly protein Flp/PilA
LENGLLKLESAWVTDFGRLAGLWWRYWVVEVASVVAVDDDTYRYWAVEEVADTKRLPDSIGFDGRWRAIERKRPLVVAVLCHTAEIEPALDVAQRRSEANSAIRRRGARRVAQGPPGVSALRGPAPFQEFYRCYSKGVNGRSAYSSARASRKGLATMRRKLTAFLKDESGATAIEYGLIAAGIALVIIPVVKGLGTNLKGTFGSVSSALK